MSEYTTVPVQAWACGCCKRLHTTTVEADDCCKCGECGIKFQHEHNYGSICDPCMYGGRIREARREVAREAGELRHSIARLRGLVLSPPEGKKAPRKGIDPALVALDPALSELHAKLQALATEDV